MARHIEHGSVLSQEDYDYLKARVRVDEALNSWGCTLGEGVGDDGDVRTAPPLAADLGEMQGEGPTPAREPGVLESVHPDQVRFIEGSEAQGFDLDEPVEDEDDEVPPYSEWLKADLQAEIDRRNADRDEDSQIVPDAPGNKPELVAALEADDEANDEADSTE